MQITTLVQWCEPDTDGDHWHNPGETADIDPATVFDLQHLIDIGTIAPVDQQSDPQPPQVPAQGGN